MTRSTSPPGHTHRLSITEPVKGLSRAAGGLVGVGLSYLHEIFF